MAAALGWARLVTRKVLLQEVPAGRRFRCFHLLIGGLLPKPYLRVQRLGGAGARAVVDQ